MPNNGLTNPSTFTKDVVNPYPNVLSSGSQQPAIYSGYTGNCKSIQIDSDNGAKLTIQSDGTLKVKE